MYDFSLSFFKSNTLDLCKCVKINNIRQKCQTIDNYFDEEVKIVIKKEKKNHHYVPKFHLKNFSNNAKSVGMYVNKKIYTSKKRRLRNKHTKNISMGRHKILKTN